MMIYKYTSSPSMVKEFDNAKKKNQYCVRDISFQIRNINEFVSKEWTKKLHTTIAVFFQCNYYLKNGLKYCYCIFVLSWPEKYFCL